jgi:alkylation response protein AidB-like acyl-CoA dehydrogenase
MTNASHAWGSAPSKRFEAIAERFRGIFAEIGEDSIRHDLERELRFDDYEALKKAGFSRLRLPEKFGGLGLTLPELFA